MNARGGNSKSLFRFFAEIGILVCLILSSIAFANEPSLDLTGNDFEAIRLDPYRPTQCKTESDIRTSTSPYKAVSFRLLKFSVEGETLFYAVQHQLLLCRKIDDKIRWVPVVPPRDSALLIESDSFWNPVTQVHFFEQDQFGPFYISNGKIDLNQVLKKKELVKLKEQKTATGLLTVRVGYNIRLDSQDRLITYDTGLRDFKTGFLELRFTINPVDQKVSVQIH